MVAPRDSEAMSLLWLGSRESASDIGKPAPGPILGLNPMRDAMSRADVDTNCPFGQPRPQARGLGIFLGTQQDLAIGHLAAVQVISVFCRPRFFPQVRGSSRCRRPVFGATSLP